MTPAQERALAIIMAGRVIASAGLPGLHSKPFADQNTAPAPAEDTYVPALTPRVRVAQGAAQRRAQHGILSPAQRKREAAATAVATVAPTFRQTHDLRQTPFGDLMKPQVPHMSLQAIVDMLGIGPRGAAGAVAEAPSAPTRPFPQPVPRETGLRGADRGGALPTPSLGAQRSHIGLDEIGSYLRGPAIGKQAGAWVGRNVLEPAYVASDKAVATAMRDLFTGATGIGGPSAIEQILHPEKAREQLRKGYTSSADLSRQIQTSGLKRPDIKVKLSDLTGLIGGVPVAAAGPQHTSLPLSQLAGETGWGLTDSARARGTKVILRNGWTQAQLEALGIDPTTFIEMQYNKPKHDWAEKGRALGADVVTGGSQFVGLLGLASETAQGRGAEAAAQFADQLHQVIPVFGKHPYSQELEAHPLFSATAGLAALKGGGAIGHLRPGPGRERLVPLAGTDEVANLGHYHKNVYTQTRQALHDLIVSHSPKVAQWSQGRLADLAVRQVRSRVQADHQSLQVAFHQAERTLPEERRADLMAIQDHGGPEVIRKAVAHFEALKAAGKDVPQHRLELEKLIPVIENLTPEDRAWMDAHAALAEHTSTRMVGRGEFSEPSRVFRQYETAIELGAAQERRNAPEGAQPDGPFTRAKQARSEFQHFQDTGEPTASWLARDKEIGKDIQRHTRGATTKAAKAVRTFLDARQAYLADLKTWRATQREIKAREPEAPPKPPRKAKPVVSASKATDNPNVRTQNFPTRKDALDALRAVRAKHPNWKLSLAQGKKGSWDATVERVVEAPVKLTAAEKRAATVSSKKAAKVAETHAGWRAELKAHNATRPKAPAPPRGVSRQAGRLEVHEGQAKTQQARRDRMAAAAEARLKPPREQIFQEYRDAVAAAVGAHHAEPGAITPVRVQRSEPPVDKRGKFRRGKNLTTNLNVPAQRSEGQRALSGEYLYDTSAPLRENFNEMLTRMKAGLYNEIVNNPLVHDVTGGGERHAKRVAADGGSDAEIAAAQEPQHVPQGYVAVPVHYLGSKAQVTVPHWEKGTSIYMHEHPDPNVQKGLFKRLHDRLKGEERLPGEVIPDGQRVLLVPKGLHDRLDQYAHPNDADPNFYDRFNRGYQRLLIGIYPSTWLGNAPGSIPLAAYSGALHPRDYYRAFKSGPQGPVSRALGIERTDTRNAATQNLGVSRSLGEIRKDLNPVMQVAETGRSFSIAGENFSAAAAWEGRARVEIDGRLPWLRSVFPQVEGLMPKRLQGAAKQLQLDAEVLHQALKDGTLDGEKLPPHLQEVQDRVIQHVVDFMSEGSKPHGELSRMAGRLILFHHWVGHILKLTLLTLPLKHPGRAVLINALAMYGNQYRHEHGVYPSWMGQFFPVRQIGNYVYSLGFGQLTPLASAQNLSQAGTNMLDATNPYNSISQQLVNVLSPILQPAANAILTQRDNAALRPNERAAKYVNPLEVLAAGAYYALPGAHKFQATSGYKKGAAGFDAFGLRFGIPGTAGLQKKTYYEYIDDGSGGYVKVPIRWEDRPGGQPVSGSLGAISRVLGTPLERSANRGRQWTYDITNARTRASNDWYKSLFPPTPPAP